jgi:preprotein translocase subunit SecG
MIYILGIIVVLASVLLILAVMVQNSKGGGLDSSFGAVSQIGNVAQSTETIEKATWYLAAVIAFVCLISVFIGNPTTSNTAQQSQIVNGSTTTGTTTAP